MRAILATAAGHPDPRGCVARSTTLPRMEFTGFPVAALDFYDDLEVDNTKSFWEAHKGVYDEAVKAPFVALTAALERYDANVLFADNGKEGLEILARQHVDVVLMDIMMPEMDGYETMREIRRNPRFRTLPILALTAKSMRADREKCILAGATDYIAKPVDMAQLLSLLRVRLAG